MKKIFLFITALCCSAAIHALEGAAPGVFTINDQGDKVQFAHGNLQATYNGSNWTWGLAENQWSYIGNAAANNAITGNGTVSANGIVDLFCWSTNKSYYGINKSKDYSDYSGNFVEWGDLIGEGWRSLIQSEWQYMFEYHRHGQATVNGIHGLIFMPDGWTPATTPGGLSFQQEPNNWTTNKYTVDEWNTLEDYGALFLPAAGVRYGSIVDNIGAYGNYWTATTYIGPETDYHPGAYYVDLREVSSYWGAGERCYASSVRLVHSYSPSTGIDEIVDRQSSNRKFIKNGQLIILRDGKMYNVMGVEIR